jgi:hypothetical protein
MMKKTTSSNTPELKDLLSKFEDELRASLRDRLKGLVAASFGLDHTHWGSRWRPNHCSGMSKLKATRDSLRPVLAPVVDKWLRKEFLPAWRKSGALTKLERRWRRDVIDKELKNNTQLNRFLVAAHPDSKWPRDDLDWAWRSIASRVAREDARRDAEWILGGTPPESKRSRW